MPVVTIIIYYLCVQLHIFVLFKVLKKYVSSLATVSASTKDICTIDFIVVEI